MKNKFYLKEFQFFDGEDTVVFNILSVEGSKITVAVTKCGKISVSDYELHTDKNGLYFEYGVVKNISILMTLKTRRTTEHENFQNTDL